MEIQALQILLRPSVSRGDGSDGLLPALDASGRISSSLERVWDFHRWFRGGSRKRRVQGWPYTRDLEGFAYTLHPSRTHKRSMITRESLSQERRTALVCFLASGVRDSTSSTRDGGRGRSRRGCGDLITNKQSAPDCISLILGSCLSPLLTESDIDGYIFLPVRTGNCRKQIRSVGNGITWVVVE